MFPVALRVLSIKDLKDLRAFFEVGGTIDMQDLKDLKRCFHVNDRGGQAPALRARKVFLSIRRSGSGDPELRSLAPLLLIVIIL